MQNLKRQSESNTAILFLCTGNYYRSRFAELYFNFLAGKEDLPVAAFSRGFEVFAGRNSGPLSRHTIQFMERLCVPLPECLRFPEQLLDADFDRADRIIALDRTEHEPMLQLYFPHRSGQVEYWDFADVQFETPARVLPALKFHLEQFFAAWS